MAALDQFHPEVSAWFRLRFGAATDVQAMSWPRIARGEHVLATAPTGSGKTLTAFLWAIDAFASGRWEAGATRVLYISPLKALNNDIRANLSEPLQELRSRFEASGLRFPELRAETRSGDSSPAERRRMLRQPPELLITTPESLSLLLTSVRGRQALATVKTVIVDEVHSVVENRRGVQLMTGLERLVEVAGEFQRVALSATVRPLEAVAAYVGGRDAAGAGRQVAIVRSTAAKTIDLRVRCPPASRAAGGEALWTSLVADFLDIVAGNRATLLFANSRRLAEKIALKMNVDRAAPLAYAHHGSLVREIRTEVEQRLKRGEMKAIVATSSLEMGIDIGDLDEVVLIASPPSIAAAVQRIGRAGHRVGETSRATLFPTFPQDFVAAAVLAKAVQSRDIEPLAPLCDALDVLAQTIVSCAATQTWSTDALFTMLTRAAPYHDLAREQFDLVVEMLAGRYAGTRIRDLRPRLAYDRIAETVRARRGATFALYASGGTIPDRGYFTLRHVDSGAAIGELDEEFVWEAKVGQTFSLGAQHWQIQRITHNDVLARSAPPKAEAPPFWRSEEVQRSVHFSVRIGEFLEAANERLAAGQAPALQDELDALGFDPAAAGELVGFLERQRQVTHCDLPHANHLLIEHVRAGPGGYHGPDREQQVVLHTLWGGRVNQPLSLALAAAWRQRMAGEAEIHADNNAIVVQVKEEVDPAWLLSLVTPDNFEHLLAQSLEGSGFFGARFRECAGRSLLLTKRRIGERMPLWMTRLQAKKLMATAAGFDDFPVLLETWRTCLRDEFDLPAALARLERIASGELAWSVAHTAQPSPFAAGLAFSQIGRYMYADDTPQRRQRSALDENLVRRAVFDPSLRPRLEAAVVADFESRAQRTRPGYAPVGESELREWVKERVAIPERDWFDGLPVPAGLVRHSHRGRTFLVHPETVLGAAPVRQAGEMLQFYGPRRMSELAEIVPFDDIDAIVRELLDAGALVEGALVAEEEGAQPGVHVCDAENLETLIRFQRASARPAVEPRPAEALAPFLAAWQRLGAEQGSDLADRLRGFAAPVDYWLDEALRTDGGLDALIAEGVCWRGAGRESVAVGFADDLERLAASWSPAGADGCSRSATDAGGNEADDAPDPDDGAVDQETVESLFVDPRARYTFDQLREASALGARAFNAAFWRAVWDGRIAADDWSGLRAGRDAGYRLFESDGEAGAPALTVRGRGHRRPRRMNLAWPGTWYRTTADSADGDLLTTLEDAKERCRMLLDRYGVVTREHANREGGPFRWGALFPALRIMELSGEVLAGLFFTDLSGPQFVLPQALRSLERLRRSEGTFWINALDPVSPCGLGLRLSHLPQRRLANHLGWFEGELAVVSENYARRLTILLAPDDAGLDALLPNLAALCRRRRRLAVESINGEAAGQSAYLPALGRHLELLRDHKGVYFQPKGVQ